jgi:flagellar basal-body rod protein FlgF
MSSKGIFTALSGAMAQSQRLDTIANNIANANTPAFKKDQQTFYEYLTSYEKPPDVIQVPRVPAAIESFYDMQGGDRSYVDSAGTYTSFAQGQLKPTGSTLDMALEGKGLFEVLTPQGVRYSRNGQFKVDTSGTLVTKDGFPVLKDGTQDPAQRRINVDGRNLTVSRNGDIYDSGNLAGRVSVVEFINPDSLQKTGSSLYTLKPNFNEVPIPSVETQVQQGFIELSNVNIVDEMTDMISASRTFETAQKAMKAFDQMDEKLVNVVPKA